MNEKIIIDSPQCADEAIVQPMQNEKCAKIVSVYTSNVAVGTNDDSSALMKKNY